VSGSLSELPVVVVGGGLAGVTAALDLVDAGRRVVLLESRARFGGATSSFTRAGGPDRPALVVDTGQHVGLRCYQAWSGLLARLGTGDLLDVQPAMTIPVLVPRPSGPPSRAVLARDPLPAPFHLARALLGYRVLPPRSRLRAVRAAMALRAVVPTDPATDRTGFGTWLRAHGQDAATVAAVWDLFTVAACNAGVDEVSLAVAATTLQRALLCRADAADIAVPVAPLAALHVDPAVAALRAAGADVRRRTAARAVRRDPDGDGDPDRDGNADRNGNADRDGAGDGLVVDTDAGPIRASGVVCAVPAHAARALLPAEVDVPDGLVYAPIVNVHVLYDRRVTDDRFVAAVGSDVQWVFDRTGPSGLDTSGGWSDHQYLAVSLSAAQRWVDVPAEAVVEHFLPALRDLFPAAAGARVVDAFVTRERRATFVAAPGTAALRPAARTAVPGLVLAGAWTSTGLPDTMEGAVVSGHAAARELTATGAGLTAAGAGQGTPRPAAPPRSARAGISPRERIRTR